MCAAWQLVRLADGHEANFEGVGHQRPKQKAARLDT